jgi:hypothetical protein
MYRIYIIETAIRFTIARSPCTPGSIDLRSADTFEIMRLGQCLRLICTNLNLTNNTLLYMQQEPIPLFPSQIIQK